MRILLSLLLAALSAASLQAYPLTVAQQERLQTLLPATLQKLERRQPILVALVGDGVSQMVTLDENRQNLLLSLHGHFLRGLEQEFYYPGGVRVINPIAKQPAKIREHLGEEIFLQHFTEPGATSLTALQMITTRVFLNQPDLVIIQLGMNDLRFDLLAETTRRALSRAVELCLANGAEVILVGPTFVRDALGPQGWGATRLHAAVVREVAEQWQVMYLDPALGLGTTRPAPPGEAPEDQAAQVSRNLAMDLFDYGPGVQEGIFMNTAAHRVAGQAMMDQFLNGMPAPVVEARAVANLSVPGELTVELDLTNPGPRREGIVTALNIGRAWEPEEAVNPMLLEAGGSQSFAIRYRRRVERMEGETPVYHRLTGNSEYLPCSFLVSDLDRTHLVDVRAPMRPVAVIWDFAPRIDQRESFTLRFRVSNPGEEAVSGSYRLSYAEQQARGTFDLEPGGHRDFPAECALPRDGGIWRETHPVRLEILVDDQSFVYERTVEVTRDLVLDREIPLERAGQGGLASDETGTVAMRATADEGSLQVLFATKGIEMRNSEGQPAMLLELGIDGRPELECQGIGFIKPLRFSFNAAGGAGRLAPIAPGSFGNGYAKELDVAGILGVMEDAPGGAGQVIRVVIPRVYFYRHEWALNEQGSRIGLMARLKYLRGDPGSDTFDYPDSAQWTLSHARHSESDPAGLPSLDLRTGEPNGWSVRLY